MTKPVHLVVVVPNIRVSWFDVELSANVELPPSTPTHHTRIITHETSKVNTKFYLFRFSYSYLAISAQDRLYSAPAIFFNASTKSGCSGSVGDLGA